MSGPSSAAFDQNRPLSITELAIIAQENLWDPSKGLKHWLRTAEKARRTGDVLSEDGDYERAFVELARAATIVLEKLPMHRDYTVLLNAEQRNNLAMNGQDILESLSKIKPVLVERFESWAAANGISPSSILNHPSTSSSQISIISREEASRRRREEQQRAQEEERAERARHALEAARREQDWQREEFARRQAEERERQAREEGAWVRQSMDSRRQDEAVTVAERRASEARALAERERQAERIRRGDEARRSQTEDPRREDELKRRADERRRQEQEGIIRRQQEAEAAALAVRLDVATRLSPAPPAGNSSQQTPRNIPVAAPQPSHPSSSSQGQSFVDPYSSSSGLSIMPLESPTKNDDDSSTDVEGTERHQPWHKQRHTDHTPTKSKLGISYPPPITTTSPAPPELGPIRYPALMSQHQLRQGYVPSLQSMFSKPSSESRAPDSSLLFDSKPSGNLYSGILPRTSTPVSAPVIPPYPTHMPVPESHNRHGSITYPQTGRRGPSPSGARYPPSLPAKDSAHPTPQSSLSAPRIVQSTSADSSVRELKTIKLPRECLPRFLSIARINTSQNRETCGLLLGKDKGSKFVVTTLLIPKQHSTSDTCTMDEEELVLQFTEERHLITLGWIHTHPTQSCFMSSVDLHTHSGFQRMLPESFAVVCAPSSTPTFGIFRLTDPGGLQTILECTAKNAFHPHPEVPIYTDCDNSHVQMKDMSLEIVDLR
ncbi:hypothetical protein AcV5_009571 [Taiwanofungus camphoratus]|nr:hypothetical protein AcV5_009571 [Antrodia cinnamomea]